MLEYIEEELAPELASGRLSNVGSSDPFFTVLGSRFPIGLNRIAWEKVKEKRRIEVLPAPRQIASDELKILLNHHVARVGQWLAEEGIEPNSSVLWLGDMTDAAVKMSAQDLIEFFPVLFSFPQHSYALACDGSWCLNYVMEGELFFARAPVTRVSRPSPRET